MSRWRLWRDDYWGSSWNDRRQYGEVEVENDDEVVQLLKEEFAEEVVRFVEIDGDENLIQATLMYCVVCDEPLERCECVLNGDDEGPWTYIGVHATRED